MCDAESPGDETLMEAIRQNLIHNNEWLGKDYTPAENHSHNGTDSAPVESTKYSFPFYFAAIAFDYAETTRVSFAIWVPNDATSLNCSVQMKRTAGSSDARAWLKIGTTDGTKQTTTSATFEDKTLTVDVSSYQGQLTTAYIMTDAAGGSTTGEIQKLIAAASFYFNNL